MKSPLTFTQCPCQSHKNYADCCQPLHEKHSNAETAEQLMRSRYCAFVVQNVDYIIDTTVPAQQKYLPYQDLLNWAKQSDWQGLEVLDAQFNGKIHAEVEFKAYFKDEHGVLQTHHERSAFVQISGRWYFIDPTVPQILTMKQPCFCHSGKKFKHCCGQFLA